MYECDISRSLESGIGIGGLSLDVYEGALKRAQAAADALNQKHQAGEFLLTRLPGEVNDLTAMRALAHQLSKDTTDLIVLGIGGSSLGAQTLAQLSGWGTPGYKTPDGQPTVHMPENLDPVSFEQLLAGCDLRTTRFLVVSKSGETAEPLSQLLHAMTAIENAGGGKYMKHHFGVVTGAGEENPLRLLAIEHGFPILEHDNIGGRFSVFSNTGLVPALFFGLSPEKLRLGAKSTLEATFEEPEAPVVACAAVTVGMLESRNITLAALTVYDDRLQRLGLWFRQLCGESLGKDGQGLTPLAGVGPVDQHSQLQLFLGGPNDKLHTFVTRDVAGEGQVPNAAFAKGPLSAFAGKTMGDLLAAEQRATIETLAKNGRPIRELRLPRLQEENLGALLMHFMLETILVADMMGVDPFDQPAVEEGKNLARTYLAG
jgi:glucose-6-phosphate isomerase